MLLHEKEFIDIGFVRKAHGFRGHAKIVVEDEFIDDLLEMEFVFLDMDGCKVPFYIESLEENKDLVMKLEHISNPEILLPFHQKRLYLTRDSLQHALSFLELKERGSRLAGISIIDAEGGLVGVIERVEEYPQQLMAVVRHKDKGEILIPLHDKLILAMSDKEIKMDLPDGLV